MAAETAKLSLVIPMFNEEANAEKVTQEIIEELEKGAINYELILVNNGSSDGTGIILTKLAQENATIKTITVPENQGYGWGILNGLHWATGEYLGYMGGDGQIDPQDVAKIFKHMLKEPYPLYKAHRYRREDGPLRNFVSNIFNKLFVYTFKVNVGDINGSPKIMSRQCYECLNLSSKDWFLDAEVIIKANYLSMKVGEVPVVFRRRHGGRSSVRLCTVWEFLRNMITYHKRGVFNESSDLMWRQRDTA